MRRTTLVVALAALTVVVCAAGTARAAGATWTEIKPGFDKFYLGVDFVDANNGWLVGEEQVILRTWNGGATWTQQHLTPGAYALHKIHMDSATRGWAVGNGGAIFATTEGSTWTPQISPVGGPLQDLCFLNGMEGWAVGSSSHIIHTTTGGADPDGGGPLTGWSVSNAGVPTGVDDVWFNGVDFVDSLHGWAVGEDYYPQPGGNYWATVYGTADGGASWSFMVPARTFIPGKFNDVDFFAPSGLWACGEDTSKPYGQRGMVYYTNTPGSPVWTRQTLPADTDTLYSIHFVTASLGWAVGDDVILVTTNGGGLWTKESGSSSYMGILTDIDSIDGVTAWAAGYGDRLMRRGAKALPAKPTAKSPKGIISTTRPTFRWAKTAGATKYEVRVYKGSKKLVGKTGLTTTSWRCSKALPKGVWLKWKVRASNSAGAGAWASLSIKVR